MSNDKLALEAAQEALRVSLNPEGRWPMDVRQKQISALKAVDEALAHEVEKQARCQHCDGTGDVHDAAGEWRGECSCEAGTGKAEKQAGPVAEVVRWAQHAHGNAVENELFWIDRTLLPIGTLLYTAPPSESDKALDEALADVEKADEYIDALLDEVLGPDRPEWSSAYGHADAMSEVRERMSALLQPMVDKAWNRFEAAITAPSTPPSESDKDDAELWRSEFEEWAADQMALMGEVDAFSRDRWGDYTNRLMSASWIAYRAARAKKEPQ